MLRILAFLALTFLTTSAQAALVSHYLIEPAPMISGGRLKISEIGRGNGYRQLKFKYKLQTSVGYREDWLPINFPEQIFNSGFLSP